MGCTEGRSVAEARSATPRSPTTMGQVEKEQRGHIWTPPPSQACFRAVPVFPGRTRLTPYSREVKGKSARASPDTHLVGIFLLKFEHFSDCPGRTRYIGCLQAHLAATRASSPEKPDLAGCDQFLPLHQPVCTTTISVRAGSTDRQGLLPPARLDSVTNLRTERHLRDPYLQLRGDEQSRPCATRRVVTVRVEIPEQAGRSQPRKPRAGEPVARPGIWEQP